MYLFLFCFYCKEITNARPCAIPEVLLSLNRVTYLMSMSAVQIQHVFNFKSVIFFLLSLCS